MTLSHDAFYALRATGSISSEFHSWILVLDFIKLNTVVPMPEKRFSTTTPSDQLGIGTVVLSRGVALSGK